MDLSSQCRITRNRGALSHYPTLKRLDGKHWPQLKGLPSLADRATTLGGVASWPPVMETRSYENEILYGQKGYLAGSSPTWVPTPPCKQFLYKTSNDSNHMIVLIFGATLNMKFLTQITVSTITIRSLSGLSNKTPKQGGILDREGNAQSSP